MPRPPPTRVLTAHERSQLSGTAFDLEEMRRFVTREWPNCVSAIMPVVENLYHGVGVRYGQATGAFYARGPGQAHAQSELSLDQDFVVLRADAKRWLPPRPPGISGRYDRKRGWTIDDPIGRLTKFQLHKFEQLEAVRAPAAQAGLSMRRASRVLVDDAAFAHALAAQDESDAALARHLAAQDDDIEVPTTLAAPAVTPTKHSGKRPRASAEASSSRDTGDREAELQRQLAVAHAEPRALDKLSLGETRMLKRELQSALHRCQLHEEKLEAAEKECVVCFNAPKEIAFGPCGHLAACEACSRHAQMKRCPICQGPIKQRLRIFNASA